MKHSEDFHPMIAFSASLMIIHMVASRSFESVKELNYFFVGDSVYVFVGDLD